eukprot:TRINITY_DN24728_c0_g1_i1.p1 TRINITY_DN24728_c0_g1~~TRINITY_DN24728_c0_g1_i1.p1  ORF type:complete len:879 (+),score=273.21 TRINITY_DN24728_c0_g1_i1:499-3135(+)
MCSSRGRWCSRRVRRRPGLLCRSSTILPGTWRRCSKSYVQQQGEVVFAEGQTSAGFALQVIDDPAWNMEAMFEVVLSQPKVDGGARTPVYLGRLPTTRVVVLNDENFPHGLPEERLGDRWALVRAFLQHNYYLFESETRWGLFWKTVPAISFLVGQLINMKLVNLVANNAGLGPDYVPLLLYMAGLLLNFALQHLAEEKFGGLGLTGGCLTKLRMAMVQTMLQLTEDAQDKLPTGKLIKAVDQQVGTAVSTTFLCMFDLYAAVAQLCVSVGFVVYLVVVRSGLPVYFCLVPCGMLAFDCILFNMTIGRHSENGLRTIDKESNWSDFLLENLRLRRVVADFRQGMNTTKRFERLHREATSAAKHQSNYTASVIWATKWMPEIMLMVIIFFAGREVMSVGAQMNVGSFTAIVSTGSSFGSTLSALFASVFQIGNGFASIRALAGVLNADTRRKSKHRWWTRRAKMHGWAKGGVPAIASISSIPPQKAVIVHDVRVSFPGMGTEGNSRVFDFECEAGSTICVRGPNQAGKTTLLRLLGQHFLPKSERGWVYVPPSWVVRYVDSFPMVFDGTLRRNLRFGNSYPHRPYEIWKLCEQLGMSERCLYHATPPDPTEEAPSMDDDTEHLGGIPDREPRWGDLNVGIAGDRLAMSDRMIVMIARALLSGVDLLLLAGTLDLLGERGALRVVSVLNEAVRCRAVPVLESENRRIPVRLRKPKTVFVATKLAAVEQACDHTINVCKEQGQVTAGSGNPASPTSHASLTSSHFDAGSPLRAPLSPPAEHALHLLGEENQRLLEKNQQLEDAVRVLKRRRSKAGAEANPFAHTSPRAEPAISEPQSRSMSVRETEGRLAVVRQEAGMRDALREWWKAADAATHTYSRRGQ